ncbi:MAG: hypothetical protein JSS82_12015 [Bacteroidetes bacterium]|nr:hypothetical protein [Bacteroidota bacterium]
MSDNKSNPKENAKDYPGYPHYPSNEDVMHGKTTGEAKPDEENGIVMGTDADVTKEDLELLNRAEQNMDTTDAANLVHAELDNTDEDGDPLNEEANAIYTGDELDVPGSELDDRDEATGDEDEENNYYSLGGDDKENLEEDISRE